MSINVRVYDNGDHTCLVWLPADGKPIPQCRGFTIRRVIQGSPDVYLHGFVGFSDDDKLDLNNPWKHPVQRFMWYDYGVRPGQVVQYSVVPVTGDKSNLQLATADASALTAPMTITGQATPHISAYFNKGIVAAQWVSRVITSLGKPPPKMADLIAATQAPKNELRNALSGLLRPQLLAMLDDVKAKGGEIYAALYELNDPELIDRLKALGQKCHLILANGAFKPANHNDENRDIRSKLRGVVDLHDRIVTGNHFAHNKFIVCCDAQGNPQRALSGSTNWTVTGLCTQANNGIIVDDPKLAQYFVDEWNQLKAAGNAYPPALAAFNSTSKTFNVDNGTITQWFAPTNGGPDLDYARKLINGAKEGILFLFFNPGQFVAEGQPENKWTLLQNILFRHHQGTANFNAGLYVRGVVNQEIAGLTGSDSGGSAKHSGSDSSVKHLAQDPTATPVTLYSGGEETAQHFGYDSMVPKAIKDTFHNWAKENLGSGVHVHSKVVVIDPFGQHPVVMTGSHNLGFKASSSNDDNLMIVEGNAPLAAAYAINIIAIYQSYRWNTNVEKHRQDATFWHGLEDNDTWQSGYLSGDHLNEYKFWLGTPPTAGGAMTPPASGGPVAKTVAAGPAPVQNKPRNKKAAATKKSPAKKPTRKTPVKKAAAAKKTSTKKSAKKKAPAKKKKAAKKKSAKSKKSKKK
jgi:phosphatidylserine/phosphatidylglycerophosphate/cardiolipin synthase-like enzyme